MTQTQTLAFMLETTIFDADLCAKSWTANMMRRLTLIQDLYEPKQS